MSAGQKNESIGYLKADLKSLKSYPQVLEKKVFQKLWESRKKFETHSTNSLSGRAETFLTNCIMLLNMHVELHDMLF